MATVSEASVTGGDDDPPYSITSDVYSRMIEQGLIPHDRRVFLWGGSPVGRVV